MFKKIFNFFFGMLVGNIITAIPTFAIIALSNLNIADINSIYISPYLLAIYLIISLSFGVFFASCYFSYYSKKYIDLSVEAFASFSVASSVIMTFLAVLFLPLSIMFKAISLFLGLSIAAANVAYLEQTKTLMNNYYIYIYSAQIILIQSIIYTMNISVLEAIILSASIHAALMSYDYKKFFYIAIGSGMIGSILMFAIIFMISFTGLLSYKTPNAVYILSLVCAAFGQYIGYKAHEQI